MITHQDYINALRNKAGERIMKLEFIDKYSQVVGEDSHNVIDGSINIQLHANSRRNCSLVFMNKNGEYIPNEDSNFWINRQFKLYTGLEINGQEYWNLRGTFYVSNPTLDSNFSDITATIAGLDKWARIDGTLGGKLENPLSIEVGELVTDVVRDIFTLAGETETPIIYPSNMVTPYTINKASGDTYSSVLIDLANLLSWEVFYDVDGRPRFQPPVDSKKEGSVWHFGTDEVSYHGASHTYKLDEIRNIVKVYGDNINGLLVTGIAEDQNIFSPTYVNKIGRKPEIIEDNLIYSVDLANQRAVYELGKLVSLQESVNIKCLPIDVISEGDIITIEDEDIDLHRDRFQVQTISESLRFDSEATISVWKERSLT